MGTLRVAWGAVLVVACASAPPEGPQVHLGSDFDALRVDAARALSARDHAKAVELYGLLAREDPIDPNVHLALGYACIRLDRWQEAEAAFRDAHFLRPGSGEALLGLGISLHGQGRSEEAEEVLQAGLETLPPGPERDSWRALVEARLPGIDLP